MLVAAFASRPRFERIAAPFKGALGIPELAVHLKAQCPRVLDKHSTIILKSHGLVRGGAHHLEKRLLAVARRSSLQRSLWSDLIYILADEVGLPKVHDESGDTPRGQQVGHRHTNLIRRGVKEDTRGDPRLKAKSEDRDSTAERYPIKPYARRLELQLVNDVVNGTEKVVTLLDSSGEVCGICGGRASVVALIIRKDVVAIPGEHAGREQHLVAVLAGCKTVGDDDNGCTLLDLKPVPRQLLHVPRA
mmetsp:Transcript_14086/g.42640  ORF Transcript_14086/g.42640 Transcript_14086/m.42640 type:complete len:247 (+) Transcript_14086:293-1033(+)